MPDSNIIEVTINNGESGDGGKVGKALKIVEEEVFRGGEEYGIYVTPPRTEVDFERTWKEEVRNNVGGGRFHLTKEQKEMEGGHSNLSVLGYGPYG